MDIDDANPVPTEARAAAARAAAGPPLGGTAGGGAPPGREGPPPLHGTMTALGLLLLPLLVWLNTRSFSTDILENLFGRVAQLLHFKPPMKDVVRMLSHLELLSHWTATPFSADRRPWFMPGSRAQHYDIFNLVPFCSGAADEEGSAERLRSELNLRKTAARITRKYVPVREFHRRGGKEKA